MGGWQSKLQGKDFEQRKGRDFGRRAKGGDQKRREEQRRGRGRNPERGENVYKQGEVVRGWSQSGRKEHVLGLPGFRLRSSWRAEEE